MFFDLFLVLVCDAFAYLRCTRRIYPISPSLLMDYLIYVPSSVYFGVIFSILRVRVDKGKQIYDWNR